MRNALQAYVLGGLSLIAGLPGCGNRLPPRVEADRPDPEAASRAMELYDANHDGFLDAQELEKAPGLRAAMERIDVNHQGKISAQQIADRIKRWTDSGTGRTPVHCRVTRNGKPLAGAKVAFVPEKFLGGTLQSGSGATSPEGYANITAPYAADVSVRGLSPGFYRVEITKPGENIPTRYNSKTTFGAEISSEDPRHGLIFDLKY